MASECHSCGSRKTETRFPLTRIKGMPLLCLDCLLEWPSEVTRPQRCAETAIRNRARVLAVDRYRRSARMHLHLHGQPDLFPGLLP